MATGNTNDGVFNLPFPISTDPVNVHGDIEDLAARLKVVLPPLGISAFQMPVINISGESLPAGTPVLASGYTTKTTVIKALASSTDPILGLLKQPLANNAEGVVVVAGVMESVNTSSFSNGDILYVGSSGGLTNTRPSDGAAAVGIVANSASSGIIIVEAKGNGTWGALKAGLS
jgi:hypothetical protein